MTAGTQGRAREPWLLGANGVTWGSLVINCLLTGGKLVAGAVFNSQAIIADGLHAMSDLVSDVAVLAGLRVSQKPADASHQYGHRRFSTLAAMFVAAALVAAAIGIALSAVQTLHDIIDRRETADIRADWPFWLALVTVPLKELLFRVTRRAGRRSGDISLEANAWHHRSDAMTSVVAALGLGAVMIGGQAWRFLDPVTALLLSTFLMAVAGRILFHSAAELTDSAPEETLLARLRGLVLSTPGVVSYLDLRARRMGGKVAMDVRVRVDPELTVSQGHDIAAAVRRNVMSALEQVVEVVVHVEPAQAGDEDGLD